MANGQSKLLSTNDLARAAGVALRTINRYEATGIIQGEVVRLGPNNIIRLYTPSDIPKVRAAFKKNIDARKRPFQRRS
jgi:DNA-binding transcriptional MerR regulator